MNYNLKGTDLELTSEIRAYLEKKLGSLEKFISDKEAARADVELHFSRGEEKTYRAEIMIHDPRLKAPLRAEARGQSLHEAIDLTVGELSGGLTRAKKKRLHNVRRGAAAVKDMLRGFRDRF